MATNYDNLKTAWQAKINAITDNDELKYEALIMLDQWIAALEQQATNSANDVVSYSVNGRSVTRAGTSSYQDNVASLKTKLTRMLYGIVTEADMRTLDEETPV